MRVGSDQHDNVLPGIEMQSRVISDFAPAVRAGAGEKVGCTNVQGVGQPLLDQVGCLSTRGFRDAADNDEHRPPQARCGNRRRGGSDKRRARKPRNSTGHGRSAGVT